jgi:hypothetical protein
MCKCYRYYRHPRTTQERRVNQGRSKTWCRAKRRGHRLPQAYDDIHVHRSKSWKDRGLRQQYRIVEMRPHNYNRS